MTHAFSRVSTLILIKVDFNVQVKVRFCSAEKWSIFGQGVTQCAHMVTSFAPVRPKKGQNSALCCKLPNLHCHVEDN